MKKVSVIIPCYNHADYIEKSVDSAINQSYPNKEIIVVDDGSDFKTKEVLHRISSGIDKLITQENQGVIHARNSGITAAEGTYILTLDADDYFEPDFLNKAVKILDQEENVGMVTCWASVKNEQGIETMIVKPTGGNAFEGLFRFNASASLLFRRKCWELVNGYDMNMAKGYEDWEFAIAVGKKGWDIQVIPEILFNYYTVPDSRNKKAKPYYPELRKYVYLKHKDLLSEHIDHSIMAFLEEIEKKNREIKELRLSKFHRAEKQLNRFKRKLSSYFRRKK